MAVGLQLAGRNEFVKVQENINDNLTKLDEAIDFNLLATLGIEYGGILNNTDAKVAGKAYYDTTGKKLYKCIANTNLSYADAGFFVALSNNDLLGKLQNLTKQSEILLSYAFHPAGTKLNIPPDCRYISIYYARSGAGEANSDFTTIPISALKLIGHGIRKNMYNSATSSYSLVDIAISTSLVMTIINSNYGIMVVGHY